MLSVHSHNKLNVFVFYHVPLLTSNPVAQKSENKLVLLLVHYTTISKSCTACFLYSSKGTRVFTRGRMTPKSPHTPAASKCVKNIHKYLATRLKYPSHAGPCPTMGAYFTEGNWHWHNSSRLRLWNPARMGPGVRGGDSTARAASCHLAIWSIARACRRQGHTERSVVSNRTPGVSA